MASGIYKITNKKNSKCYIGQSINVEARIKGHLKGIHSNPHLSNSIAKYGKENFEWKILKQCDTKDLTKWEQYYINKYKPEYNISPTAGGSCLGVKHSKEFRDKVSKNLKGNQNTKGHKLTEDHKRKIGKFFKGRKWKISSRIKLSNTMKGNTRTLGKKLNLSEEQKSHRSEITKIWWKNMSANLKRRISKAVAESNRKRRK